MRASMTALLAAAILVGPTATAQVVRESGSLQTTLEGYVNATGGLADGDPTGDASDGVDGRIDVAVRLLARTRFQDGPNVGARIVVEQFAGRGVELAESSLLLFGDHGRLEIGERQGLPDVLTGYAPNNFTFTSSDFGPASGPSLDPGGTLATSFIAKDLARRIDGLAVLGAAASLSDDRSAKVLYVSPKVRGYLLGLSYAPDASDPRFRGLGQAGIVREWYWSQHVLRAGASYTQAAGTRGYTDLRSLNAGATLTLFDSLSIGLAGTWNGDSGLPRGRAHDPSAAGYSASVNYNRGPWTVGVYAQKARAASDVDPPGSDRLDVVEAGGSWRYSTHWRVYGAIYDWRLDDGSAPRRSGQVYVLGLRATL